MKKLFYGDSLQILREHSADGSLVSAGGEPLAIASRLARPVSD
jgi:hypothetical protein